MEHAEASGELFTSLFAQQVGNKVDYAENGKRKKAEEMAVDEEKKDQRTLSTKEKQLQFLRSFRYKSVDVNEESLVRDLLYVLQGIDG